MTITDGAIMFGACLISFALGYTIGAIKVSRYVNKRLLEIYQIMEKIGQHSSDLRQSESKLDE